MNAADQLVFQTEKQLSEYGDKIPDEKKGPIEAALGKLKEAHKAEDLEAIDAATEELNAAWQAASQDMYNAGQQQEGEAGPQGEAAEGAEGAEANKGGKDDDSEVTDVDFEEVK